MNNIVAEFACSSYLDNGLLTLKKYPVVAGSTFSDEYNETLDSATLVLDHIRKEDRLIDLEPYQYVRVYDENNTANFDRIYLVDNFAEQEKNIHEHLFSYTVNLMSETKLLEKIQCPNLTITHKVENGVSTQLSIYEHIVRYIKLYSPVLKSREAGYGWGYNKLIKVPVSEDPDYEDFHNKFNVPCADMAFTAPTLRQLLTSLMQQVGCIPVVRKGRLSYLDFNQEPVDFSRNATGYTADYSVSRIQRSLSSDSYANTLVNMSENVLDSGNTVISEHLGFRDIENVLLKQEENLFLETKFPIYKVTKAKMNFLCQTGAYQEWDDKTYELYNSDQSMRFGAIKTVTDQIRKPHIYEEEIDNLLTSYYLRIPFNLKRTYISTVTYTHLTNIKFYFSAIGYDASFNQIYNFGQEINKTIDPNDTNVEFVVDLFLTISSASLNINDFKFIYASLKILEVTTENDGVVNSFKAVYESNSNNDITINFDRFDGLFSVNDGNVSQFSDKKIHISTNVTPLFLENSIRQNLETNFKNMESAQSIEDLARYLYGTIGYSIGSKRISGFSDKYSQVYPKIFGAVTIGKTYIENIYNFISEFLVERVYLPAAFQEEYGMRFGSQNFVNSSLYTTNEIINFAQLTFDIEYQPLNSFNLSFVKQNKDFPFAIEQYDSNASALTDFDRLVIHEQETVDRIGNQVLSISQRVNDLADIRGTDSSGHFMLTYFRDDNNRDGDWNDDGENTRYILFKRQIAVNDYYYDVSYTGMENAILKNYFTSIRTKYRAYQNVDYNQSVLRKERDVIYLMLNMEGPYGDSDNIHFISNENNSKYFIDSCMIRSNSSKKIENTIEVGTGNNVYPNADNDQQVLTKTKNEVSVISSNNLMAFVYENSDNVGNGTVIGSIYYSTYYTDTSEDDKLAGVPQKWQIWAESYMQKHQVLYACSINNGILNNKTGFLTENETEDIMVRTSYLPVINATTGTHDNTSTDQNVDKVFSIGKEYESSTYSRLFYKDYAERINHTIQFIYCTNSPDNVAWTELFVSNSSLILNSKADGIEITFNKTNMFILGKESADAEVDKETDWYTPSGSVYDFYHSYYELEDEFEIPYTDYINVGTLSGTSISYIEVFWHNLNVITIAAQKWGGQLKNIISFKKPSGAGASTKFYLAFMDTKTTDVYERDGNGVLHKIGKANSALQRTIISSSQ